MRYLIHITHFKNGRNIVIFVWFVHEFFFFLLTFFAILTFFLPVKIELFSLVSLLYAQVNVRCKTPWNRAKIRRFHLQERQRTTFQVKIRSCWSYMYIFIAVCYDKWTFSIFPYNSSKFKNTIVQRLINYSVIIIS